MAEIMVKVFGDKLLTKVIKSESHVPSPFELRNKIIVKAKKLTGINEIDDFFDEDDAEDHPNSRNGTERSKKEKDEKSEKTEKKESKDKKKDKKKPPKVAQELSDLVVYNRARHFSTFEDARKNSTPHHISSFAEAKVEKLASDPLGFIDHTNYQYVRTYPAGKRVQSGNYDPVTAWALGCQIVALRAGTFGVIDPLVSFQQRSVRRRGKKSISSKITSLQTGKQKTHLS